MKTTFSREDACKILFDSFCNGGIQELYYSNVIIDWDDSPNHHNYIDAKARLQEKDKSGICYEDVILEILRNGDEKTFGNVVVFKDVESIENHELTLNSALDKINSLPESQKKDLIKILNEDTDCDAWTSFNALQLCLLGDVVFG